MNISTRVHGFSSPPLCRQKYGKGRVQWMQSGLYLCENEQFSWEDVWFLKIQHSHYALLWQGCPRREALVQNIPDPHTRMIIFTALLHPLIPPPRFREHHSKSPGQIRGSKGGALAAWKSQVFQSNFKDSEPPITRVSSKLHLNEVICRALHHGEERKLDWSPNSAE